MNQKDKKWLMILNQTLLRQTIEISKKIMQKEVTKESQDEVINNFLKDN
nr:hypothetical protein [Mycoplasmopsis bovis]